MSVSWPTDMPIVILHSEVAPEWRVFGKCPEERKKLKSHAGKVGFQ